MQYVTIIWNFIKKWWPYLLLGLIVILSAVLRFIYLRDHLHFDADEADHTETIYGIFKDKHLVAKGPSASGGTDLYHGAYYYYLYLIPAILAKGNPLSLAAFTIILNLASIPLLFFAIKKQFKLPSALAATTLYSFSYAAILYSRWIWNPNTIPFFYALALFSLAKIAPKNERSSWWLVVFAFSVSSISQLHIGSVYFVLIFILMMPLLTSFVKGFKQYLATIFALIIPWIPTIEFELRHGFALSRAFAQMLHGEGAKMTFVAHMLKAWEYFLFMFDITLRLPATIFIISFVCFISAIIFKTKWKDKENRLLPAFLFLSFIFLFLACGYYNGTLFIHFAEQLFVLIPICVGVFLGILLKRKEGFIAAILIIILALIYNWNFYKNDILLGDRQFGTQKKICQTIKDKGLSGVEVIINGKINPAYIRYTCGRLYKINFGSKNVIVVDTDFRDKLDLSVL